MGVWARRFVAAGARGPRPRAVRRFASIPCSVVNDLRTAKQSFKRRANSRVLVVRDNAVDRDYDRLTD